MKKFVAMLCCMFSIMFAPPVVGLATAGSITLPNYAASTDITSDVQSKGKKITNVFLMIVAILCILGIIVGGGYFGVGQHEKGKTWVLGGVLGLILAGSAYGIAALVI